jgi:hypothetical protein
MVELTKLGELNAVLTPASISSNLDKLGSDLSNALTQYQGLVVTEENLPDIKKGLAYLRSAQKAFERRRIDLKKEYDQPFIDWKDKYDIAMSSLNGLIDDLAQQVVGFDEKQKQERNDLIREMVNERIGKEEKSLWPFAERPWFIFHDWTLKSYTPEKIAKDIEAEISEVKNNLSVIANQKHVPQVLARYLELGSLGDALRYESELERQDELAEQLKKEEEAKKLQAKPEAAVTTTTQPREGTTDMTPGDKVEKALAEDPRSIHAEGVVDPYVIQIDHPEPGDQKAKAFIKYTMAVTGPLFVIGSVVRELKKRHIVVERISIEKAENPMGSAKEK